MIYLDFQEDYDLHMVLLKQYLSELSYPVIPQAQKVSCFYLKLHVQYIRTEKQKHQNVDACHKQSACSASAQDYY